MNMLCSITNPNFKALDCTIRDGGLVNDHYFSVDFVKAVYRANLAAGVDYMEIGYKNSDRLFSRDSNGAWKFCDEDDICSVVGSDPDPSMKLSCMIDAAKSDWKTAVHPKEHSPLSVIRVAFYEYQLEEAIAMIEDAYNKGYEVSANLMAVTTVEEKRLDEVLKAICKTPTDVVVIVDSFGSMTPKHTEYLTQKYMAYASEFDKEVGIHAHNNMQLALCNTLVAASNGATRLDVSLGGLGRGAGNCSSEMLLAMMNPNNYNLRPLFECLEKEFVPLHQQIEWGPTPEYILTAINNVHPRSAIKARKSEETRDKYTLLYDQLEQN